MCVCEVGSISKIWDSYETQRNYVSVKVKGFIQQVSGSGEIRDIIAHAPLQVQELGDVITRRTKSRIQSREDELICSCWCVDLLVPLSVCVPTVCSTCIRISVCASVLTRDLPTCVRRHFLAISCGPETSGSRSCDGHGNGLSNTFQINFPLV